MMNYPMNKKLEYWKHFVSQKQYHYNGMTIKRLKKVLPFVLVTSFFWDDVLMRHSGDSMTPEEMKTNSQQNYEHCMGNMASMVFQIMVDQKIIKIKK